MPVQSTSARLSCPQPGEQDSQRRPNGLRSSDRALPSLGAGSRHPVISKSVMFNEKGQDKRKQPTRLRKPNVPAYAQPTASSSARVVTKCISNNTRLLNFNVTRTNKKSAAIYTLPHQDEDYGRPKQEPSSLDRPPSCLSTPPPAASPPMSLTIFDLPGELSSTPPPVALPPMTFEYIFDLPGELRNKIYIEAVRNSLVIFRDKSPLKISFTSALPLVSRQVRAESIYFIYSMASIRGRTSNFCSGSLSFGGRLTINEMKAFIKVKNPSGQVPVHMLRHKPQIWNCRGIIKRLEQYPDLE